MPKTLKANVNLANEKEPQVMQAIQLLWISPSNKKEIANQVGLDVSQVHKIYQIHFVKKKINPNKMTPPKQILQKEVNKEVETKPVDMIPAPAEPVTINVTPNTPTEEEKVEVKKGGRHLSEDLILAVCSAVEKGMSYAAAGKKYGVSDVSVRKYCIQMGIKPQKNSSSSTNSDSTIVTNINSNDDLKKEEKPKFVRATNAAFIRAALIDGRHDMPTTKYIYEAVDNAHLFNFTWYEDTVRDWILKNIPKKDGVWLKTLNVLVTGLPAASIAVAKVCGEMGVNLIFSHYNADNGRYEKQVFYNNFPVATKVDDDPAILGRYFEGVDVFVLNNTNITELYNTRSWYCISVRKMIGLSKADIVRNYLVKEYEDIWSNVGDIVSEINKLQDPHIVQCNIVSLGDKGDFIFKDQVMRSYNKAALDKFKESN